MIETETTQDQIQVRFCSPFTSDDYRIFLKCKLLPEQNILYYWQSDSYNITTPSRFAHVLGLNINRDDNHEIPLNTAMFDYQKAITETALRAKRFAVWADTGLGKTIIGAEFARQVSARTGGRVLIITPLNILHQWISEIEKFYSSTLTLNQIKSRSELRAWSLGPRDCVGFELKESYYRQSLKNIEKVFEKINGQKLTLFS